MTTSDSARRRDALIDLVALLIPPRDAVAAMARLPWDSDEELVLLRRAHVASLLHRYLDRDLTEADLEAWANAVEGREDIGIDPGDAELLEAFVFETANPVLAEPISNDYARRWLRRLDADESIADDRP